MNFRINNYIGKLKKNKILTYSENNFFYKFSWLGFKETLSANPKN